MKTPCCNFSAIFWAGRKHAHMKHSGSDHGFRGFLRSSLRILDSKARMASYSYSMRISAIQKNKQRAGEVAPQRRSRADGSYPRTFIIVLRDCWRCRCLFDATKLFSNTGGKALIRQGCKVCDSCWAFVCGTVEPFKGNVEEDRTSS